MLPHGAALHHQSRPGEVTGKERGRQWHPPPRRGRQGSSIAATPRPRAPPENAPQNLRGSPNHRCRGAAAASGAVTPASRDTDAERSELRGVAPPWRSGRARGGVAGRARGGWGRAHPPSPLPAPGAPAGPPGLTAAAGRGRGAALPAAAEAEGKPLSLS